MSPRKSPLKWPSALLLRWKLPPAWRKKKPRRLPQSAKKKITRKRLLLRF